MEVEQEKTESSDLVSESSDETSEIKIDGLIYQYDHSGSATVIGYNKKELGDSISAAGNKLIIPSEITVVDELNQNVVYQVEEIADGAFQGYWNDSSSYTLELNEGLKTIGSRAFDSNRIVGSIHIPDSVTTIKEYAFYWTWYDELYIGEGVTSVTKWSFESSADEIKKISLGSGIREIDPNAFGSSVINSSTQIIVNGDRQIMEPILSEIDRFKKANIIYVVKDFDLTDEWLQEQIDNAPDYEETIIEITEGITIKNTVIIPENKNIILTNNGNPQTINLSKDQTTHKMFLVSEGATLTFEAMSDNGLNFVGGGVVDSGTGNIVDVKGTFYLKSATLTGATINPKNAAGVIVVDQNGLFEMHGGVIENTKINTTQPLTAPVVVKGGGTFNMTGGIIRNNENLSTNSLVAGGVLLYTWNEGEPTAVMNMSNDAEIIENSSQNGGGIYLIGDSRLTMDGGNVSYNYSYGFGGGIVVAGTGASSTQPNVGAASGNSEFIMNDGVVSHNTAVKSGGGIYVNSSKVKLHGGYIEYNKATQGGGIYVSEPPQILYLYDALITENKANSMGGGLWFCPTGAAEISVTNGASIFKNSSDGAGDDFVSVGGIEKSVTLSDRSLGGGILRWYEDGGVIGNSNDSSIPPSQQIGMVDPTVPRYDATNPIMKSEIIGEQGSLALKAIISEEVEELSNQLARLYIRYNEADRGGGIGSNGSIEIGKQDEEWKFEVLKKWQDVNNEDRHPIVIFLKVGDYIIDSVILNEENNWSAVFEKLPNPFTLKNFKINVVEEENEYEVDYSTISYDEDNKKMVVEITNSLVSNKPDIPSHPDPTPKPKPEEEIEEEETPEIGDEEEITEEKTPETGNLDNSPNTGVYSKSILLKGCFLSASVIIIELMRKKKIK